MSTSFDFDQWVFIGDIEEYKMWLSRDALDVHTDNSGAIKNVELDFQRRYRTLCYRMIHRKASLEMYKRLESNTFGKFDKQFSIITNHKKVKKHIKR